MSPGARLAPMDAVAGWMLRRASHFTTNDRPRPLIGRTASHSRGRPGSPVHRNGIDAEVQRGPPAVPEGVPEVRGRAARMVFEHEPEHDWIVEESGGEAIP